MVGGLHSFWEGIFSGVMFNFGWVILGKVAPAKLLYDYWSKIKFASLPGTVYSNVSNSTLASKDILMGHGLSDGSRETHGNSTCGNWGVTQLPTIYCTSKWKIWKIHKVYLPSFSWAIRVQYVITSLRPFETSNLGQVSTGGPRSRWCSGRRQPCHCYFVSRIVDVSCLEYDAMKLCCALDIFVVFWTASLPFWPTVL